MKDVWKELKKERTLTPAIRLAIEREFGAQGRKAISAVCDNRIWRYNDFFVVAGTSGRYIVDEDFCTCSAFLFRGGRCWHILAVRIAELTGSFEIVNRWYLDELRNSES